MALISRKCRRIGLPLCSVALATVAACTKLTEVDWSRIGGEQGAGTSAGAAGESAAGASAAAGESAGGAADRDEDGKTADAGAAGRDSIGGAGGAAGGAAP